MSAAESRSKALEWLRGARTPWEGDFGPEIGTQGRAQGIPVDSDPVSLYFWAFPGSLPHWVRPPCDL